MFTLPAGIIFSTYPAMTSPTPAAVKIAPKQANNIGNIHKGPTVDNKRSESFKNTAGLFSLDITIKISAATTTPTPTPTRALISVNNAKIIANTPIQSAGMNTFIPFFSTKR